MTLTLHKPQPTREQVEAWAKSGRTSFARRAQDIKRQQVLDELRKAVARA